MDSSASLWYHFSDFSNLKNTPRLFGTARSVEDETRNARRNAKRTWNPRWSKFMFLFKWAVWKETWDEHSGFRLAFRRAFRVSSSTERAVHVYVWWEHNTCIHIYTYGVATISRLLKMIGLLCRISFLLQGSFAKETYNIKEPTNRSHLIHIMRA